jgi:hypothetical protein
MSRAEKLLTAWLQEAASSAAKGLAPWPGDDPRYVALDLNAELASLRAQLAEDKKAYHSQLAGALDERDAAVTQRDHALKRFEEVKRLGLDNLALAKAAEAKLSDFAMKLTKALNECGKLRAERDGAEAKLAQVEEVNANSWAQHNRWEQDHWGAICDELPSCGGLGGIDVDVKDFYGNAATAIRAIKELKAKLEALRKTECPSCGMSNMGAASDFWSGQIAALSPEKAEKVEKSQVRINAENDTAYAPYCLCCPRCVRMKKIEDFYWRCECCGAEHDERTPAPKPKDCPDCGGDGTVSAPCPGPRVKGTACATIHLRPCPRCSGEAKK